MDDVRPGDVGVSLPSQIGPYRVLQVLGEGGMGIVYLAEQREPVRRRVALKVIRLGMDSKAVLARFEAERRALALMEHSCIARVLDAGVTPQGQPFFAMEYVKGVPITDYCDQNLLAFDQRIELFRQVCAGVQHAHLKGVMHRDLKPGNVLVTLQDGVPTPKIIDFGLAKATDHHLVEATVFTEQGVVLGTPEYMSPEQAGLNALDVDTRTDVYSLGVLLYEMLVGDLPFPRKRLREAGFFEMQRVIREQEAPRPSTKVAGQGASASAIAGARRLSVGELRRKLSGDIDWIVLKALEKDRTRRYQTAADLASDLERHHRFEPVLAGPPDLGYRLKKFVRRYRAQCAIGATLVVALLFGGASMLWALHVANERAEQMRVYADVAKVAEARKAMDHLLPARPERVAAMAGWLQSFEPLRQELPFARGMLAALERRVSTTEDAGGGVDSYQGDLRRIEELLSEAPMAPGNDELIAAREHLRQRRDVGSFSDSSDLHLFRTLRNLVADLEAFCGERGDLARVRQQLELARSLRARSIDAFAREWEEATAAIRESNGKSASTLYRGLTLRPQLGLIPVGMDAESKLWEFVDVTSGETNAAIPRRVAGRLDPTPEMGVVFVLIPGGKLPVEHGVDTTSRNQVVLDPFFLGKYEVTQGQWVRLDGGRNPSRFQAGEGSRSEVVRSALLFPVESVDWTDCETLLRRAGMSLPSELQWEYACRAGTSTRWWTGASVESLQGNERIDHSAHQRLLVGSLRPNPFGLFDMAGNVWEWCRDADGYFGTERAGDGLRLQLDGTFLRVVRGGGHSAKGEYAASRSRGVYEASFRFARLGVRAARAVERD